MRRRAYTVPAAVLLCVGLGAPSPSAEPAPVHAVLAAVPVGTPAKPTPPSASGLPERASAGAAKPAPRAEDGLQLELYLPFDEGSGASVHDAAGGLTAELVSTTWVEGRFGWALSFNGKAKGQGGSCVVLPATKQHPFFRALGTGPFTLEAWVKPSSKRPHNQQAEIINTGGEIGPGYRFTYAWRMLRFLSGTGKRLGDGKGDTRVVTTDPSLHPVDLDAWNHVAVTRDGSGRLVLYLNGEQVAASTAAFDVTPGTHALTIGSYLEGYAYTFEGAIDEVRIYRGAKSAADILRSARAPCPAP